MPKLASYKTSVDGITLLHVLIEHFEGRNPSSDKFGFTTELSEVQYLNKIDWDDVYSRFKKSNDSINQLHAAAGDPKLEDAQAAIAGNIEFHFINYSIDEN